MSTKFCKTFSAFWIYRSSWWKKIFVKTKKVISLPIFRAIVGSCFVVLFTLAFRELAYRAFANVLNPFNPLKHNFLNPVIDEGIDRTQGILIGMDLTIAVLGGLSLMIVWLQYSISNRRPD
jgi:hypothetical protein